jgi:hypothetical protein
MPSQDDAAWPAKNADPWMGLIVLIQVTIIAAQASLSRGVAWKDLLHWAGEVLLIAGIALAAKGVSDVRREWTSQPGLLGSLAQMRPRASARLWAWWNKVVERWPDLAERLRVHIHQTPITDDDSVRGTETHHVTSSVRVEWNVAPSDGTPEERLAWLEARIADAGAQIATLDLWHHQEVMERQAATEEEQAARVAEDQRIRELMADLAGGGLRLQAWGVACLLLGTLMTAIW